MITAAENDGASRPREPVVSIIIPAYNTAEYIREALESVLAQTFTNFEMIVVNDGSPDTPRLEAAIEPLRAQFVYLKRENGGPSAARNTGIREAKGEYVAFLDSDDSWFPAFLASQISLLRTDPTLDLVYSDLLLFGDSRFAGKNFMQVHPSKGSTTFESVLVEDCQIPTSGVVARRQALLDAGLFDEQFVRCEDYDLWLRLAHRGGRIAYHCNVLGRHRVHSKSLAAEGEKLLEAEIEVIEKLARTLQLTLHQRSLIDYRVRRARAYLELARGKAALLAGQPKVARVSLGKANRFLHSAKLSAVLLGLRCSPQLTRFAVALWRKGLGSNHLGDGYGANQAE